MDDTYGIDVDGPISSQEDSTVVPEFSVRLNSLDFATLQQMINPLAASDDFGIDLYEQVLQFMSTL